MSTNRVESLLVRDDEDDIGFSEGVKKYIKNILSDHYNFEGNDVPIKVEYSGPMSI